MLEILLLIEASVTNYFMFDNVTGETVLSVETVSDYVAITDVDDISHCPCCNICNIYLQLCLMKYALIYLSISEKSTKSDDQTVHNL